VVERRRFPLQTWTAALLVSVFGALATVPVSARAGQSETVLATDPGASLSVHLLTIGPGDRLWELFGHNALLVRDLATGYEAALNYGIFDSSSPGFAGRFLRGRMLYATAPQSLAGTLDRARAANREVRAQELELDPAQRSELLQLLQHDALPENRFYRYHYYLNNCSTKLRDLLDRVLDGQLRAAAETAPPQATWRDHTRRLTSASTVGYLGLQLLVGPRGDRPTTPWEEMWVPMKLRDTLAGLTVVRADGTRVPLVRSEALWVESTRPAPPASPPDFNTLFPLAGAAIAILFGMAAYWAKDESVPGRLALGAGTFGWAAWCSFVSLLLVAMHWTDHEFLYWNWNILVFSPACLGLTILFPRAAWRMECGPWLRRLSALAVLLAGAALLFSFVPGLGQDNREWAAFALPVHLSVWWIAHRILKSEGEWSYS